MQVGTWKVEDADAVLLRYDPSIFRMLVKVSYRGLWRRSIVRYVEVVEL